MKPVLDYRIDMKADSRWDIVSAHSSAKQHLIYLQEAGLFYSGSGYYTTREGLDSYLIKLTLSGSGVLTYDGQSYTLRAGDYFFIDCRRMQDYRTAPDWDHWDVLWIHFSGKQAAEYYELFQKLGGSVPVGHLPENSDCPRLMKLLLELYRNYTGDLHVDIRSASLLTQLLTGILEAVTTPGGTPVLPPTIAAVRDYLAANYRDLITLEDLSRRFNISKFYLQRTFSRYLGISPAEYQQKLRLAKAKELLRTTDLPVSKIAEDVGMKSISYFISAFKKQEGATPLKYRSAWSKHLGT